MAQGQDMQDKRRRVHRGVRYGLAGAAAEKPDLVSKQKMETKGNIDKIAKKAPRFSTAGRAPEVFTNGNPSAMLEAQKRKQCNVDKLVQPLNADLHAAHFKSFKLVGPLNNARWSEAEMAEKYILGVDIGSSNVKAVLFALDGTVISVGAEEVTELFPAENCIEQDAEEIWAQFQKAVRTAVHSSGVSPEQIVGLGLDSNRCGCLLLDGEGRPLIHNMTWRDTRSNDQVSAFCAQHPEIDAYHITGEESLPQHTLFKLLWIQEHQPEIWEKAAYICLSPKDYVILKMLGVRRTSRSIAQSTGLFDINRLEYSQPILQAAHIDPAMLPELLDSNQIAGRLKGEMAAALGLAPETPVICGLCDATASQVGSGSVGEGKFTISIGTCGAVRTFTPEPRYEENKATQVRVFSPYGYVPTCTISDAGGILKWFRNQFCAEEVMQARQTDVDAYQILDREAEQIPPGSDGLLLLSSFTGASYAFKDKDVFGAFVGIRNHHTRAHFARAIMEGVSMTLRVVLERFLEADFEVSQIRLGGGGARSELWIQILADVLKVPIYVPDCEESGCLGSAIMAALGLGLFQDLDEAVDKMVRIQRVVHPDPDKSRVYDNMYRLYTTLYHTLSDAGYFRMHGELIRDNGRLLEHGSKTR